MANRPLKRRKGPTILGAIEPVLVRGDSGARRVLAKIDTGASRTTIDFELAAKVGLGPVLDTVRVRAAMSEHSEMRALVDAEITVSGEKFSVPVAITDRGDMRYHVVIGMDILRSGPFLIDPARGAKRARQTHAHSNGKFE